MSAAKRSRARVQLAQRRAVLPAARATGGRFVRGHSAPRRIPGPQRPTAITASYGGILRRLVGELGAAIKPAIAHAAAGNVEATQHALERAARAMAHHVNAARAPDRLAKLARQVSKHQEASFDRMAKARLGTPLFVGEAGHGAIERAFVARNRALIDSLAARAHEQIASVLHEGMGKTEAELTADVEERLDVAKSRADLIADNQISRADSAFASARIDALGIGWIWRQVDRPTKREDHAERVGQRYSEDDPPDSMPGEEPNCECWQEPVFAELTQEE